MNERAFRIFAVDDDPVAQMITADQSSDPAFAVGAFGSGKECLAGTDQVPGRARLLASCSAWPARSEAACRRCRRR